MDEQYEKQVFKSPWSDIREHAKRDAIILVSSAIPLAMAAKAIVENNSETVNVWIEQQTIGKPSQEQLDQWGANLNKPFLFFIAQPYVLVQEVNEQ